MLISPHFHLEELVPKEIFQLFGAAAIQFIDHRIVNILEFERDYFGKAITVNNWNAGGSFNNRGYRDVLASVGAGRSQHKFGRAVDRNIDGMTCQEHYAEIIANTDKWIGAGVTTLEDIKMTNGWVHSDCRDTSGFKSLPNAVWSGGILIVQP